MIAKEDIQKLLIDLKTKNKTLAERLGMSPASLFQHLNGKDLGQKALQRIADALGVEYHSYFTIPDDQPERLAAFLAAKEATEKDTDTTDPEA